MSTTLLNKVYLPSLFLRMISGKVNISDIYPEIPTYGKPPTTSTSPSSTSVFVSASVSHTNSSSTSHSRSLSSLRFSQQQPSLQGIKDKEAKRKKQHKWRQLRQVSRFPLRTNWHPQAGSHFSWTSFTRVNLKQVDVTWWIYKFNH